MKIVRFLILCTAILAEDSLNNVSVGAAPQLSVNTTVGFVTTRFSAAIEIDFMDDVLSNIIWFSASGGDNPVIGLSDTGYLVHIRSWDFSGTTPTISKPSILPLLDSDGTPLTVEIYTASGAVVSGDLTLASGIYAGFNEGNNREFSQVTESTSGVVAKSTNPVALCDSWLAEEIVTGCQENGPATLLSSAKPEDSTETIGSIFFSCRSPSEELSIPGWSCNPSTGDSTRFSIKTDDKYTLLSAMVPCAACDDPYHMFFLFTHNNADGSQKSVSIESMRTLSDEADRVVLFSLETSGIVFLSLSVVPKTESEILVYLFGYNVSSPTTAYVMYTYEVDMDLSTASASTKNDYTLSVFVLFFLLCLGIAIPLLIRLNPHVRTRIENVRWIKQAEQIGLVGDSADESDAENRKLAIPKKFGHQYPHTPRQLKPINESNIPGS